MTRFIKSRFRIPKQLVVLFIVCHALVITVNTLVGALICHDPLTALKDKENLAYIFLFGTGLSLGIYCLYSLVVLIERLTSLNKTRA